MDVERRLIIMRRIAGAVGTAVLQILKWMLKIVLGALKLFLGLDRKSTRLTPVTATSRMPSSA